MTAGLPKIPVSRLLACFSISGAAGLIYQIAWAKALGLIFGHTVYAVTVVFAVFMAGLAMGSIYFGRLSDRTSDPIKLYVRLEFLVALTGVFSLLGLHAAHLLYVATHPVLAGSQTLLIAIRSAGAVIVLFIPVFLMGGTFPTLVSAISHGPENFAKRVSQLYWANTGGATVGAILTGFVLLPSVGLWVTIIAAGSLNMIAGFLARSNWQIPGDRQSRTNLAGCNIATVNRAPFALFVLFALVGCSAFGYEVAWTRMLAITIGSSTYAFTLVLGAFLLGITIGSMLFQFYISRSGPISVAVLGWVEVLIAAAALSSLIGFRWVPEWIPVLLNATHRTFAGLVVTQFAAAVLTVFPVAVLFGFNFPMVIDLISHKQIGFTRGVGTAYAINTIGAIAGSVITGFWLVPSYGSFRVIAGVSAVNLLLAFAIHLSLFRQRLIGLAIDAVLLTATFLIGSSPFLDNQSLLTLSAVLYGSSYGGRLTVSEIAATKDLVYAADGVNDSVAVVRTDGDVALRLNGKIDASTQDASTQLLLGHLGAAFHAKPSHVLIVGFGSGMTASAVTRYPDVQRIDAVEIEPAVLKASRYMPDLNRGVLKDSRLHITIDDARDFLLTSRENYDLIISEPSNPWISGVATLFTKEYYAAARKRLRPGGIFVQWVQAYSLAPADLRMIIGTFATGFADVTLWRAGETDLLLLGRMEKSPLSLEHLHSLWRQPALRGDYASLKVHEPEGLAAYFLLDDQGVRQLAQGSPFNTDDRTALEYDAPRSLLASDSIGDDRALIARFLTKPLPPLSSEESQRAPVQGLITALDLGDLAKAQALVNSFQPKTEDCFLYTATGRLALLQNDVTRAKAFFDKAVELDKTSPEAAYWLAVALRRGGDSRAALAQIQAALALNPNFVPALQEQMELTAAQGDFVRALSAQLKRMALIPDTPAYEYGRLGALWLKIPDLTQAESALLKGLEKDPYCYACHLELGDVYVHRNELALARQQLEWVIRFFPDADPAAFTSLVVIDQFLKDTTSARRVLDEGRRLFPNDAGLMKAQAAFTSQR